MNLRFADGRLGIREDVPISNDADCWLVLNRNLCFGDSIQVAQDVMEKKGLKLGSFSLDWLFLPHCPCTFEHLAFSIDEIK